MPLRISNYCVAIIRMVFKAIPKFTIWPGSFNTPILIVIAVSVDELSIYCLSGNIVGIMGVVIFILADNACRVSYPDEIAISIILIGDLPAGRVSDAGNVSVGIIGELIVSAYCVCDGCETPLTIIAQRNGISISILGGLKYTL